MIKGLVLSIEELKSGGNITRKGKSWVLAFTLEINKKLMLEERKTRK